MNFIITVNDNGELKTVSRDELPEEIQKIIDDALSAALDHREFERLHLKFAESETP